MMGFILEFKITNEPGKCLGIVALVGSSGLSTPMMSS